MKISIRKVLVFMRKNGFKKLVQDYIENRDGEIYACALGQAALNINLGEPTPESLDHAIAKRFWINTRGEFTNLSSYIVDLNDYTEMSIPEIADAAEGWLVENGFDLDTPIFV